MSNPADFPYTTHLNILHGPLELMDIVRLADSCSDAWYNQTLARVNDCVVRLGVVQGEYHWHKHDEEDELFYVVSGLLIVDLQDRSIELKPGQAVTVPRGVVHRTRAPERTVMLMVEGAGVIPTGD